MITTGIADSLVASIIYSACTGLVKVLNNPLIRAMDNTVKYFGTKTNPVEIDSSKFKSFWETQSAKKEIHKFLHGTQFIEGEKLASQLIIICDLYFPNEAWRNAIAIEILEYFKEELLKQLLDDPKTSNQIIASIQNISINTSKAEHKYLSSQLTNIKEFIEQSLVQSVNLANETLDKHTEILNKIVSQVESNDNLSKQLHNKEQVVKDLSAKLLETEKELSKVRDKGKQNDIQQDAFEAFQQGDFEKARCYYEDLRKTESNKEIKHAATCYMLGNIYYIQLNFKSALKSYIRSTQLDTNNSKYQKEVGKIFGMLSEFSKSLAYYKRALKIDRKQLGEINMEVADDLNYIGITFLCLGDYLEAQKYFTKSVGVTSSIVGPEHHSLGMKYNNIGISWRNLQENEKAIKAYNKSLKINLKALGENHPEVAKVWNNLANIYMMQGELIKAIELFQMALNSDLVTFGEENPEVAKRWHNIGLCYAHLGKGEIAVEFLEKALHSDIKIFGEYHPEVSQDYFAIGIAWQKSGNAKTAIPFFEKSLALDSKKYGDNNPILARRFAYLGQAWLELGDINKAMKYLSQSTEISDGNPHERPRSFTYEK